MATASASRRPQSESDALDEAARERRAGKTAIINMIMPAKMR